MAGLHFPITADNSNFMNAIREVTASVRDASRQIEADGGNIDKVISKIKGGLATLGVGLGFKELAGQIFNTRAQFEQLEIAFTTMLGSAEKANSLLNQLKQTAAKTPFEMEDVVGGAKSLLAYGIEAEKVNDTLIRLGDIASGLSIPLNDLTYLYGTTMVQGRMFTQDFRQFQGRGIPIAEELSKVLGVAKEKVGDAVTAGKVGAKELEAAIKSMTDEGGRFGGLMAKQSDSLKGKWENIKDTIGLMFNEIGQQTSGVMNLTLDATASIVDHWQDVVAVLGTVATAYGAQKAYLMLDTAFTTAKNDYAYDSEIAQLKALIPIKEEAAKTDLQQAVASGKLTEERAKQIASLRDEANAQLEALAKKEAAAKREEEIALAKEAAAKKEVDSIQEQIAAVEEKIFALSESFDAEEAASAYTELNTLETAKNEAVDIAQTAVEEAKAASINVATAAQERETLATGINTAQTTGNTAATGILTIAKEKLAIAIGKVNAAMKANKISLIIGLIIGLGYVIKELITYQSDYEKSIESAKNAANSQIASMRQEKSELVELKKKLESTKKGSDEWKAAKDQIVAQFGTYFPGLDAEIERTGTLTSSYNRLTKAIRLNAAARAMDKFRTDYAKDNDMEKNLDETLDDSADKLEGSFLKRDRNGDLVKDNKGKYVKIKLTAEQKERLQQAVYNYATTGNLDVDDVDKAYLEAAGILSSRSGKGSADKYLDKVKNQWAGEKLIARKYGTSIEEIDGTKSDTTQETKTRDGNVIDKDIEELTKKLPEYKKTSKEYADTKAKIEKLKIERKNWGDESDLKAKKHTGPTADQIESKQTDAHQKLLDLMRQQAEERLKLQQDYEYQQWQNRIDLMGEGEAKVLEQMRLDQSKERSDLEEQKKQAVQAEIDRQKAVFDAQQDEKAAGNKKYAKKVFNPETDVDQSQIKVITERYDSLNADLLAKQKKAENDRLESAKESMNNYLKEFGNYQQKREAIEEEYQKKIDEAPNSGERKIAIAQRDKQYADLDFEEWQENGGMALAFGDISKLSKETVEQLISDMEKYRSKIIATFDPDKIQKFEEALANLRSADIDFDFTFAGDSEILDAMRERLALQQQIADAEANEAELLNQKKQLEQELNTLTLQSMSLELNTAAQDPNGNKQPDGGVSEETVKHADELRVKLDAVNKSLSSSTKTSKQLQSQLKALGKVKYADIEKFSKKLLNAGKNAAELASIFSDDVSEAIQEGAEKVGVMIDAFTELSSNIEILAKSGKDVVKETTDAAKDVVDGAKAGMEASAASASASLSTMEKASAILAIIGAAIQLATMVASLVNPDKKHEKNIERLQEKIEVLQKSYDKLGKAAENAYSTDASGILEQQNELLEQQQALIRQQQAEEEAKKKSDKEKVKDYQQQLEENQELMEENRRKAKEAIIGKDIKGAIDDFASAYASAWEDGTDAAQASTKAVKSIISGALTESLKKDLQPAAQKFYDTLAEAMADGVLTDEELAKLDALKAEMDAIAEADEEQYKKIQERYKTLDEIREELTDISFDTVSDNFKSLLSDMESTTEDFTDNFSDMLRNALINGLMDAKYNKLLEEWYAEFADAMENGELTDEERERLRQRYQAIVDQGIADRNAINDIVGGGAYSQQASSGSAWNMSQETGDELNGRFTAMVELEATNNTLVSTGNSIAGSILATLQSMAAMSVTVTGSGDNDTLLAIRDMMFLSTGHLENIAKYTKHLQTMSEDLTKMKEAVERI